MTPNITPSYRTHRRLLLVGLLCLLVVIIRWSATPAGAQQHPFPIATPTVAQPQHANVPRSSPPEQGLLLRAKSNGLAAPVPLQSIFSYRTELDSQPALPIWSYTARNGAVVTFAASRMTITGAPTQLEDGWQSEVRIMARPRIDFNGQSGTSVRWQLSRGSGAQWSLAKLTLSDPNAGGSGYQCTQPTGQYFEIDCNTEGREPGGFFENRSVCILQLRCSDGATLWTMNDEFGGDIPPFAYFDNDRTAELKLTYLGRNGNGEERIAYAIDGVEQFQTSFSATAWGGMDWLTAGYSVVDWDTNPAITTSSFDETLDYFEIADFHDSDAPLINLTGTTPDTWQRDPVAVTVSATDDGVGIRCLRAAWDQWPVNDLNCENTAALTLNSTQQGERTLYVRAWDFAGNQQTASARYRRDTSVPTNPTTINAGCSSPIQSGPVQSGEWQRTCNQPTFTWSGATDSGVGLQDYLLYWGTNPTGTPTTVTTAATYAPSAVPTDGPKIITVRWHDPAGNIGTTTSAQINLDTIAPVVPPPTLTAADLGSKYRCGAGHLLWRGQRSIHCHRSCKHAVSRSRRDHIW